MIQDIEPRETPVVDLAPLAPISQIDPTQDPTWDSHVDRFAEATLFHTSAWARVLRDTYRFKPRYIVSADSACFAAALPLFEINSWVTGRRGVSLPFTDSCPPLCHDGEALYPVWKAALNEGLNRRWKYLELRGTDKWFDRPQPSVSFYGHLLDLQREESELFTSCDGSTRRAVRKAEASNLTFEVSHEFEAVREFYQLLCRTRKRLGVPPQSFAFFKAIYQHIIAARKGCVALSRKGGVPIAGAIFFHFQHKALYKFGASDLQFQHLRPNNRVMWDSICWHRAHGFHTLDFGRTDIGSEGLRAYKLGWGTRESFIHYLRHDYRTATFVTVNAGGSGMRERVFRNLPLLLSRLIGSALYKHAA